MPTISTSGIDYASKYDQPFQEAMDYFKSKGYELNPGGWNAIAQEANAGAFTVAKVAQMDILEDIKGALQTALESGQTYEQFAAELIPALEAKGWLGAASRLGNIFETNLAAAYNVGRWTQIQQIADERPYLQYRGIRDSRTRRTHLANFGKVYPIGHAFWAQWYPPNGFRCRCYVVAVDQGYLDANKLTVSTQLPVDTAGGQILPDLGFRYNVGAAGMDAWKPIVKMPELLTATAVPEITKQFIVDNDNLTKTDYAANWYGDLSEEAYKLSKTGLYDDALLSQNSGIWRGINSLAKSDDPDYLFKNIWGNPEIQDELSSASVWRIKNKTQAYVEYLATNPLNLIGEGISGAGTTALASIAEDALAMGLKEMKLYALDKAIPFYEKIGFKRVGESNIMKMGKKKMQLLIDSAKSKGYFSESELLDMDEIIKAEDKAIRFTGGCLAVTEEFVNEQRSNKR